MAHRGPRTNVHHAALVSPRGLGPSNVSVPMKPALPSNSRRPAGQLVRILGPSIAAVLLMLAFASGAQASVLWNADAEEPAAREWASSAAAGPACAGNPPVMSTPELSVSPSPAPVTGPPAAHPNAYHFRVSEGDDCYGPRSELG